MIFGFTGTRDGMTEAQGAALRALLLDLKEADNEFHHGDCVGADAQAHDIAASLGFFIVVHPPMSGSKRAYKSGGVVRPALPYLCRNREIVWAASVLIATPKEDAEVRRSGTWSTVRFAQKTSVPLYIIYPNGGTSA